MVKKIIKAIPLTTSGLILTLGILGINLSLYTTLSLILSLLFLFLFIIYSIKLFLEKDYIFKKLNDSVEAAFLGIYPMLISTISVYLVSTLYFLSLLLWWLGLILQVIFIIWYVMKYLTPLKIGDFLPTTYIVFAGLAFSTLSSSSYGLEFIGKIMFLISFAFMILIKLAIFRNVLLKKRIDNEYAPIMSILPFSVSSIFLSYVDSFMFTSLEVVIVMTVLMFFLSLLSVLNCIKTFSKKYNKFYASYTFPLAVTSLAFGVAQKALLRGNHPFLFINTVMQVIIDVFMLVILILVFIQFIKQISLDIKKNTNNEKL